MFSKNKNIAMIVYLLLTPILLNSCSHNNPAEEELTQTETIYELNNTNYEHESLCPNCQEGSRYFYKLSNGIITLVCEECSSLWLYPEKTGWGGAISDKVLASIFNNQTVDSLFDEHRSDWATEEDVRNSPWSVKLTNQLLLRNN